MHFPPLRKTAPSLLLLVAVASLVWGQRQQPRQRQDPSSKVTLISAQSAQLLEKDGQDFRKVTGPARFLHNNTYLLCDSALWNVSTNIIDAMGHVQIIQDRTRLKSETLQYVVDEDLAKFRGALVELEDQDHNTLRTRYLDYNTKDSVAVFQNGASMRDKDGQIIESNYGSYDSKAHLFVFNDAVNMYADTTFIKTSRLEYRSDLNTAYFGYATDMWQDDNMLSANDGWYDRGRELFFFRRNVHLLTKDQEIWSDSLYYHRTTNDLELLGRVELRDTTRNAYALAGRMVYTDSLNRMQLTRDPAVMSISEENNRRDTVYLGGDYLTYEGIRRCDIPEGTIRAAEKRENDLAGDPVMEYRRKAAEAAAKAAAEAAKNDPNRPPDRPSTPAKGAPAPANAPAAPGNGPAVPGSPAAPAMGPGAPARPSLPERPDTSSVVPRDTSYVIPRDTSSVVPRDTSSVIPRDSSFVIPSPEGASVSPVDSLAVPADSLATPGDTTAVMPAPADTTQRQAPADTAKVEPPLDTTRISFLKAVGRVKLFRRDSQFVCDSLVFTELDSLVRLYKDPIVYNEGNRQYAADSIFVNIHNQRMERANLLSNAFVTIQEDSLLFDQISGTEMVAYFDSTSALTRFDALGGATALFFLMEQDALATVNKVETKMLSALFKNGDIERTFYFEDAKSDAYPVVQMPRDERRLKDFRWNPELRPKGREDITPLQPRPGARTSYLARPHAQFRQTDIYFPGYINSVYKQIAFRDSMAVVRSHEARRREEAEKRARADSLAAAAADSLKIVADSLHLTDSLSVPADSLMAQTDSLKVQADSLKTPHDSLGTGSVKPGPGGSSVIPSPEGASVSPSDSTAVPSQPTRAELRAQERQRRAEERARRKAEKQAALEAKWAVEDSLYDARQAAKALRKLERERAAKLRTLKKLERKAQRERRQLEIYIERERRRKAAREAQ